MRLARAKVNLWLNVVGRRADGYHDLRTIFQSLALSDTVTVSLRRGPMTVTCDDPEIPIWSCGAEPCAVVTRHRTPSKHSQTRRAGG